MATIFLAVILQATLSAGETQSFAAAYQQANRDGRPLLVLVGAEWCPGCVVMKRTTMPALQQTGRLQNLAYAVIDVDREKDLSERVMQGETIPQLIMYTPTTGGWKRTQLTGAHSAEQVDAFLRGSTR